MTELERRALLGDKQAQEECTNPSCDYYFDDVFDLTDF